MARPRRWPRNERPGIAEEFAAHEFHGAQQVLERLAPAAAFHQITQGSQLLLGQRAVEVHVELHPPAAKHLGEQVFHIQPGVFHTGFLKPRGSAPNGLQHCLHAPKLTPRP